MAERHLQRLLSKLLIAGAFLALVGSSRPELPDRSPLPERRAAIRFEALKLPPNIAVSGVTVTGVWKVTADDPRLAGLSGLAVLDRDMLVAVTDSGVLIDLPKPGAGRTARFRDLIGGPGFATFKKYRDAEALLLVRDPAAPQTLGYEVAFEHRHSRFLYDRDARQVASERLPDVGWAPNTGVEAMVIDPDGPRRLMLGEAGRNLFIEDRTSLRLAPLEGATGRIADATRLPDGRILVSMREFGLLGITNRFAWLERSGNGYRLRTFGKLWLGPIDNVEGLAAEPGPDGRTIVWAVTDNDGWRRGLLIRMELDTTKAPATTGA